MSYPLLVELATGGSWGIRLNFLSVFPIAVMCSEREASFMMFLIVWKSTMTRTVNRVRDCALTTTQLLVLCSTSLNFSRVVVDPGFSSFFGAFSEVRRWDASPGHSLQHSFLQRASSLAFLSIISMSGKKLGLNNGVSLHLMFNGSQMLRGNANGRQTNTHD